MLNANLALIFLSAEKLSQQLRERHCSLVVRASSLGAPTLQKLTRHKIKIPIIYFFISEGEIYFSKKYEMANFFFQTCKKWKMSILFLNLFPPPASRIS